MQSQWPIAPWIRGWHVCTTISLTDADRTAITWLLSQLPGGLPDVSWSPDLAQQWLAWWTLCDPPQPHTWENALQHPPALVTWWFFLMTMAKSQLWKALWRANLQMATITEIDLDVRLPALPQDITRQRPFAWDRWTEAVQRLSLAAPSSDPPLEPWVYVAWRIAWWAIWQQRAPTLIGTMRPWWGLAPDATWSSIPTYGIHCARHYGHRLIAGVHRRRANSDRQNSDPPLLR